jgi:hypothetical protein
MAQRYFTVGEVEKIIPALERTFVQVLQLRTALRKQQEKLEAAGVQVNREMLDDDGAADARKVRNDKALFRAFYEIVAEEIERIEKLGGQIKDIDLGLVDFLGKRGDDDILLCWKLGEKSIGYWHAVDAGYRNRRPIDSLVPRDRQPAD